MSDVTATRSVDLVGRDAELEELSSRLGIGASGNTGGAHGLLLAGDAGVGKTRLLTELRDRALAAGWQVLAGHCLDLADGSLPYLPFSEVLGRVQVERPEVAERVMERHPALARLQPGRRVRTSDGTDGGADGRTDGRATGQGNVFSAVADLAETLAEEAPLLLVVEDAHWADQSTRDVLSFLLARPGEGRIALVVSYRSDDLHRRHPLRPQVAEWARLQGVERLQLEALSNADVRQLVYAMHHQLDDQPIAEAAVAEVVERAEGNPFFVEELVGAQWATGGDVPAELADVLLVRLDRLDDAARDVVRVVSVAGRQVSHDLLAAVTGLEPRELDAALRGAVESHVLTATREDTYTFRHALLGEAVYDDLLPGERSRLHAAFCRALIDGDAVGTAAELAVHARRSGDHATAARAGVRAGEEAFSVGGPGEAATQLLAALASLERLDAVPDGIDVPTLVSLCADALVASGRVSKAVKVLRAHLEGLPQDAPDVDRGRLLTAIAGALLLTDSTEDPEKVVAEAVALLADGPPQLLTRALAVQAQVLRGSDEQRARAVALEALERAERHNLTGTAVEIATTLAALDERGDPDQLRGAWLDGAARARAAGEVSAELRAFYFLARLEHDRGDFPAALEAYGRVVHRAEEFGLQWSPYPAEARHMQALVSGMQGRLDEAWQLLDVSDQRPPLVYEWLYYAEQVRLDVIRGRSKRGAFRALRRYWERDALIAITSGTAEIAWAERHDDPVAAVAAYDDVVATVRPLWHEWFQARLRLATTVVGIAASAVGRLDPGERAALVADVDRLLRDAERVVEHYADVDDAHGPEYQAWNARRLAEGLRWRWLARTDVPDAADLVAAWRATEAAFAAYGSVPDLARARARLASVLRATGDAAGARQQAELARTAAHEARLVPLLDELTALGAAPAPRAEADAVALTPREGEILALVAEGRTNGEIGKQLYIATKTVSVHVSNILGKLGAGSRTAAAAIARRRGLL